MAVCMWSAFAATSRAPRRAAHEEPCVFFVRLVDSRLSTCSNVCELSMICRTGHTSQISLPQGLGKLALRRDRARSVAVR